MRLYIFLLVLFVLARVRLRVFLCVCRHGWGGWRRWFAVEVCGWVLVVPPHVESHAASPLPQRVLTAGADGPQQGVRSGEMHAHKRTHAHGHTHFLQLPTFVVAFLLVCPFNHARSPWLHFLQGRLLLLVIVISPPLQITDMMFTCRSMRWKCFNWRQSESGNV